MYYQGEKTGIIIVSAQLALTAWGGIFSLPAYDRVDIYDSVTIDKFPMHTLETSAALESRPEMKIIQSASRTRLSLLCGCVV